MKFSHLLRKIFLSWGEVKPKKVEIWIFRFETKKTLFPIQLFLIGKKTINHEKLCRFFVSFYYRSFFVFVKACPPLCQNGNEWAQESRKQFVLIDSDRVKFGENLHKLQCALKQIRNRSKFSD